MPFPTTIDELRKAGYLYDSTTPCRLCRVTIEFWKTPANKLTPLEIDGQGKVTPHFATCPHADKFRKKR
jgi:hypothetical protein